VEHTQRGIQIFSITLAILVEFLVNSLFHETNIPIVDIKVQASSNFSKNSFWKKKEFSKLHEKWKIQHFQV
jgi:hypothetical protein